MTSSGKLEHIIYIIRQFEGMVSKEPYTLSYILGLEGEDLDAALEDYERSMKAYETSIELETEKTLKRIAGILEVPNDPS